MGIGGRETTRAPACRGSAVMTRYYFDIRDGQDLYPDAEGLDPADQKTAEIEAARALSDLAKDLPPLDDCPIHTSRRSRVAPNLMRWNASSPKRIVFGPGLP